MKWKENYAISIKVKLKEFEDQLLDLDFLSDPSPRGCALGIDTFDCVHPTRLGRHGGPEPLLRHRHQCLDRNRKRSKIRLWFLFIVFSSDCKNL